VTGPRTRAQLIAGRNVILLPEPLPQDVRELREGQILRGWPHCVQNARSHNWPSTGDGDRFRGDEPLDHRRPVRHVFHKNNELAGYCSVLHALQLIGATERLRSQVLAGPPAWDTDQTVGRAIEIRDGVVQNPAILSFQHRSPYYPHRFNSAAGGTVSRSV
jgi:hypothetical protein